MAKKYHVMTAYGRHYAFDERGRFLRCNVRIRPSPAWKCAGCAEVRPFGRLRFIRLDEFMEMISRGHKFTYKNGKPRYTLTDIDHGTFRVHGNISCHGISGAWVSNEV